MEKIYHVCRGKDLQELEKEVNRYLQDGWYMIGGICVAVDTDMLEYYQAVKSDKTQ